MATALKENSQTFRWSKRLTEGARQQPDHLLVHINETFQSRNSKFPIKIQQPKNKSKSVKNAKVVVKK